MEILIIIGLMATAAYYYGKARWGGNPPMPGAFSNRGSSHSIKQLIERNLDCFPDTRGGHTVSLSQEAKVLIWFSAIVIQARSQYLNETPNVHSTLRAVEVAFPQWNEYEQRNLAFLLIEGLVRTSICHPKLMARIYSPDNKQILLTINKHLIRTLNQ